MPNEALVKAVKEIMALGKEGKLDDAYAGYKTLFESLEFSSYRPEDQRQALKLMIMAKGVVDKTAPSVVDAHSAAVEALKPLVEAYGEPSDYELLGIAYVVIGNEHGADTSFRLGLTIERQRNPGSDLCGAFMKRISFL
jgi:hypothetical protein